MYNINKIVCVCVCVWVSLEHKTSLKSLGYIYSNIQKYIVWVKIINFSFMLKIIRHQVKIMFHEVIL